MKRRFTAMLERMTRREKVLVAALLSVLILLGLGLGTALALRSLSKLRDEIGELHTALVKVRRAAPHYLQVVEKEKTLEKRIRDNRITTQRLQSSINAIARRIHVQDGADLPGQPETVADLIDWNGSVSETPVLIGAARKRRKKSREMKKGSYVLQLDQKIKFKEVDLPTLYRFLEAVERSEELLFVSGLKFNRTWKNAEHVHVEPLVVTTYVWPTDTEGK